MLASKQKSIVSDNSTEGNVTIQNKKCNSLDNCPEQANEINSKHTGRIRNLAGFFSTQTGEVKNIRKKRLEVADAADPLVIENEPIERIEGVVRADDPGEFQKPIELQHGHARNLASKFLFRDEGTDEKSRKPFVMDLDTSDSAMLENEPVRLEGVVRSADKVEDVIGKRGRIKNIAGRFSTVGNAMHDSDGDESATIETERKNKIEQIEHHSIEAGATRNIAEKFKQQQSMSEWKEPTQEKPKWLIELENAEDHGVYENEPKIRDDVIRADDEQPDVISVQHTRNLKAMWTQFERDEANKGELLPERRKNIVIQRNKPPSPEPEPTTEPEIKSKSKYAVRHFGRSIADAAVTFGDNKPKEFPEESTPRGQLSTPKKVSKGLYEKSTSDQPLQKPALKSVGKRLY